MPDFNDRRPAQYPTKADTETPLTWNSMKAANARLRQGSVSRPDLHDARSAAVERGIRATRTARRKGAAPETVADYLAAAESNIYGRMSLDRQRQGL